MARLQATAEFFKVAIQETAEATHRAVVETAKREHGKVLRDNGGRALPFTRTVDGARGAPEEAVSAYGVIQYDYHRLAEVVEYAMQVLFDFSPVLKDEYRRAHTIFINGAPVADMKSWNATDAIRDSVTILNPVPYSRKIEQGRMTMRVPGSDHVYERAAIAVNRRFGNVANTRFSYRSGILPYLPGEFGRGARARRRQQPARWSAMAMERETRVPALVFDEYA